MKSFAKDVFIEQERKSKGIEDINRHRLDTFKSHFWRKPCLLSCSHCQQWRKRRWQQSSLRARARVREGARKKEKEKEERKRKTREKKIGKEKRKEREQERERECAKLHHTHAPPQHNNTHTTNTTCTHTPHHTPDNRP